MSTKKCKICGKTFQPSYPNSKFCCTLCKDLNSKNYSKSWRDRNKDYMTIYMRDYRAALKRESAKKA